MRTRAILTILDLYIIRHRIHLHNPVARRLECVAASPIYATFTLQTKIALVFVWKGNVAHIVDKVPNTLNSEPQY